MSIHRFFSQGDDTNYFHSTSYGKVAHGDRIGSLSSRTFGERYVAERNRKMVQRYHDSHVARRGALGEAPHMPGETIHPQNSATPAADRLRPQSGQQRTQPLVPPPRPAGFREPPTRGYNPFS